MNNVTFLARRGWVLRCNLKSRVLEGFFDGIRFYQEVLPGDRYVSWEFWKEGLLLDGSGETVSEDYYCLSPYLSKQELLFELPAVRTYCMYELDELWENKALKKGHKQWKR